MQTYDSLPTFDYENVVLLEILGEGGFGIVQKAYLKRQEKYVALKTFLKYEENTISQIILEDDLLKKVEDVGTHYGGENHFLKYYGAFRDPEGSNQYSVILQMESGISTLDDILSVGKEFSFAEFLHIIRQLIKGFALLQSNGIAQRDIKPQNIILVEDKNNQKEFLFKVSDFGIGCLLEKGCDLLKSENLSGCSIKFSAPKILQILETNDISQYNPYISDVFSLGILALKMIRHSFGKKTWKKGLLSHKEKFPDEFLPFLQVLAEMLKEDCSQRVDFCKLDEILEKKIATGELKDNFDVKNLAENETIEYFYDKWIEAKEAKVEETLEGFTKMFEEHKKLYKAYDLSLNKLKESYKHLEKAWKFWTKLKTKRLETIGKGDKNEDEKDENEEIGLMNGFGDIYRKMNDWKKSEEYLMGGLNKLEMQKCPNQHFLAVTFRNLGRLYFDSEQMQKSEEITTRLWKNSPI